MKLSAGFHLGPYEILEPLGAGGMGEVYRARDHRLGREVAIKIIPDRLATNPKALERFEQEAKAVASLSHPNILAIHDVGTAEGTSFAVMELLRGESLDERLARESLFWRKAVEIAAAAADGLASAHACGIVHRDLKPANIFITTDGQVKILDFGLATLRPIPSSQSVTALRTQSEPEAVAGTIGYMSPEQVTGRPADPRSDIFSLGCVLYEMLSGQRAFDRPSAGETLAAILRDNPSDLSEFNTKIPLSIVSVVRRCLEKNPGERFQSAQDLGFALREILSGSALAPPTVAVPPAKRVYRRPLFLVPAAFVLLAAAWIAFDRLSGIGASGIDSLAVLPLVNVSGDPEQEYLADGITEQLISDLARLGNVRVTSRTSAMTYKGAKKTLPQIARELSVDAIVEGSVARSGDKVKITTELINAKTERHLWANTYERDLKDVVALQREIAREVARNIRIELGPEALSGLKERRSVEPQAFEAYVRGRYFLNKGGREGLNRALEHLNQALDLDPTFAEAYAGLADAYAQIGYLNYLAPTDAFPKAKAAAAKALELDPTLAEAHATLGYSHMYYDWDFPAAESGFRKAISMKPSLASAHRYYGVYLAAMLRPDEARRETAKARALDPLSVPVATDTGFVLYYERDYDKATKALKDAIAMNPKAAAPHFWLGRVYQAQEKYAESAEEYEAGGPEISSWPPILAGLGHMYGVTGQRSQALRVLKEIERMSGQHYVSPYAAALVHLGLGDQEKTLELLKQSYDEKANWLVWLLKDPRWDPMRSDPRFQEIVRRVGFPPDAQTRAPKAAT